MRIHARLTVLPLLVLASGAANKPSPLPTPTALPSPFPTPKKPLFVFPKLDVRFSKNGGAEVATLASPVAMKVADSYYIKAWSPAEKVYGASVSLATELKGAYRCGWREGSSIYSSGPHLFSQQFYAKTIKPADLPYKIMLVKLTISAAGIGCPVAKPGDDPAKHTFSSAGGTLTIRARNAIGLETKREIVFQIG